MRPSVARPYRAEPLLATLVTVTPQISDGKRQEKNAERLPRSTPEAVYSKIRVVGAERPLPHSCSDGPRCMYSCMRTICMCPFRTVPHVNGCLFCACSCTFLVPSVLPSFLNDIDKKTIEVKEPKKGLPEQSEDPRGLIA